MKKITNVEIEQKIKNHHRWLTNMATGERANFSGYDLSHLNFGGKNLEGAIFRGADLSDTSFCGACLRKTDMRYAKLTGASFSYANLSYSDLRHANITNARFHFTILEGANIDFSSWPLWCGSINAILCDKLKAQILYHTISVVGTEFFTEDQIKFANKFHRIPEVPKLKPAVK